MICYQCRTRCNCTVYHTHVFHTSQLYIYPTGASINRDAVRGAELQCGSYCLMDVDYCKNLDAAGSSTFASPFVPSLFLLSTVMSVRSPSLNTDLRWVVIDSGLKAQSVDSGPPMVVCTSGEFENRTEKGGAAAEWDASIDRFRSAVGHLRVAGVSDEHSTLVPIAGAESNYLPPRGTKLVLLSGHCDPFVNHFDELVGVSKGKVVRLLPVARGPGR